MVETLEKPAYRKMTGQQFLAECKGRGVKPCCRGRKKETVIAELEALDAKALQEPAEPPLKLAEGPRFTSQRRGPTVVIQDHKERWVVCRFEQRGLRNPPQKKMDEYADVCCKALNEHYGE